MRREYPICTNCIKETSDSGVTFAASRWCDNRTVLTSYPRQVQKEQLIRAALEN